MLASLFGAKSEEPEEEVGATGLWKRSLVKLQEEEGLVAAWKRGLKKLSLSFTSLMGGGGGEAKAEGDEGDAKPNPLQGLFGGGKPGGKGEVGGKVLSPSKGKGNKGPVAVQL